VLELKDKLDDMAVAPAAQAARYGPAGDDAFSALVTSAMRGYRATCH